MPISGDPELFVGFDGPEIDNAQFEEQEDGGEHVLICPDYPLGFGTIFISVVSADVLSYVIIARIVDLPPPTPDSVYFHVRDFSENSITIKEGHCVLDFQFNSFQGRVSYHTKEGEEIVLPHGGTMDFCDLVGETISVLGEDVLVSSIINITTVNLQSIPALDAAHRMNTEEVFRFAGDDELKHVVWSGSTTGNILNPLDFKKPKEFAEILAEVVLVTPSLVDPNPNNLYVFVNEIFVDKNRDEFCLYFGRGLVDENGRKLAPDRIICPTQKRIVCDTNLFMELADRVDAQTNKLLNEVRDINDLLAIDFGSLLSTLIELDGIRFNNTWVACQAQFNAILNEKRNSSSVAGRRGGGVKEDENLCPLENDEDEACLNLNLVDYEIDTSHVTKGLCGTFDRDPLYWYKSCKEQALERDSNKRGRVCKSDGDCIIESRIKNSPNYQPECNYLTGLCDDTPEMSSFIFLQCFLESMSPTLKGFFALADPKFDFQVTPTEESLGALQALFTKSSSSGCVTYDAGGSRFSPEFVFSLDFTDPTCSCCSAISGPQPCLDPTCNLPIQCESTLFYGNEYFPYFMKLEDGCDTLRCNRDNCRDFSDGYCGLRCDTLGGEYFCGVVKKEWGDETFYHPVEIEEESCGSENVCVTPQGDILPASTMAEDECGENGFCTGYCKSDDSKCVPRVISRSSVCFKEVESDHECFLARGKWENQICLFPSFNSQQECARRGLIFASCDDTSVEEQCSFERKGIQNFLGCVESYFEPCSKSECENGVVGWCDDDLYFNHHNSWSCVVPFLATVNRKVVCPSWSTPTPFGFFIFFVSLSPFLSYCLRFINVFFVGVGILFNFFFFS